MILLDPLTRIAGIRHGFFTRAGGVSEGIYASKNCGFGSGDTAANVARNRARCIVELASGSATLVTAYQIHSAEAVTVTAPWPADASPRADALVTDRPGIALGILTADCAAVLMCDPGAGVVGAAHAGWKGAQSGVLESTVAAMAELGAEAPRIVAAVGPCIAQQSYEVGAEFRARFVAADRDSDAFFAAGGRAGHAQFDLRGYVVGRLDRLGVAQTDAADNDTATEEDWFFSYRRATLRGEGDYGRCLSAIMIDS